MSSGAHSKLAAGNKAVFDDLYWQHLAFQAGGIALMRKFRAKGAIDPIHLQGWELIADGIANNDHEKVLKGNAEYLFRFEQEKILQPTSFEPIHTLLQTLPNILKRPLTERLSDMAKSEMPAPYRVNFIRWATSNGYNLPDVTNLEQRFAWGKAIMVPGFKHYVETDLPRVKEKLNEVLTIEKKLKENLRMPE